MIDRGTVRSLNLDVAVLDAGVSANGSLEVAVALTELPIESSVLDEAPEEFF